MYRTTLSYRYADVREKRVLAQQSTDNTQRRQAVNYKNAAKLSIGCEQYHHFGRLRAVP